MEKNEPFLHKEVDDEQSPQSNRTWPMDKIRQSRFQEKVSSILSPVTPKRNYKSLLLQCLRDSKSDSIPRKRFPVSCSDAGILMDGVLVTSATPKKVSDSPSSLSSIGRISARSLLAQSHIKNTEFSSPRSQAGCNQDTTRSQTSSGGEVEMLANSTCTPKVANLSYLKATAEPFILTRVANRSNLRATAESFTPRSSQRLASAVPVQQLQSDHHPHSQWGNPPPDQQLRPSYTYPRSLQGPDIYPSTSPRPTDYQMAHDFNQAPAGNTSTATTPLSSHLNTNTSKPPVHTPISTTPTANLSTSTTICDSSPSVDGLVKVTPKPDLSSPADERVTMMQTHDLSAEHKTSTHKPDSSPSAGLETMKTKKDWSPSDDGLPRFTQAQTDFMKSQGRVLPDDAFEHYKYTKRLSAFIHKCTDDKEGRDSTT